MMTNKKGYGYIWTCVFVVVLCLLIAVFIMFSEAANTVRIVQSNSRIVLNSYVTEKSIEIFDSIKMGHDYTPALESENYQDKLIRYCDLRASGTRYAHYANGVPDYYITAPVLSFGENNTMQIKADYTITVPIYFNGDKITQVNVPVTAEAHLNPKF